MTQTKASPNATRFCLLCLAIPLLLTACAKKKQPPAPKNTQPNQPVHTENPPNKPDTPITRQSPLTLDHVLRVYNTEKTDDAAARLLDIQWSASDIFEQDSIFQLSEQNFAAMSQSQRKATQKQAMESLNSLRTLVTQLTAAGTAAISRKDYATAERNLNAVLKLGETLSKSNHLEIVRSFGILFRQITLTSLAQIYKETHQPKKLQAANIKLNQIEAEKQNLTR